MWDVQPKVPSDYSYPMSLGRTLQAGAAAQGQGDARPGPRRLPIQNVNSTPAV